MHREPTRWIGPDHPTNAPFALPQSGRNLILHPDGIHHPITTCHMHSVTTKTEEQNCTIRWPNINFVHNSQQNQQVWHTPSIDVMAWNIASKMNVGPTNTSRHRTSLGKTECITNVYYRDWHAFVSKRDNMCNHDHNNNNNNNNHDNRFVAEFVGDHRLPRVVTSSFRGAVPFFFSRSFRFTVVPFHPVQSSETQFTRMPDQDNEPIVIVTVLVVATLDATKATTTTTTTNHDQRLQWTPRRP